MEEVKGIMLSNIEKTLERGQQLENLHGKTENLVDEVGGSGMVGEVCFACLVARWLDGCVLDRWMDGAYITDHVAFHCLPAPCAYRCSHAPCAYHCGNISAMRVPIQLWSMFCRLA